MHFSNRILLTCLLELQGDAVTEWIQEYMIEHFGLQEVWLPNEETLEHSKGPITPSKPDSVKRVAFGSKSLARSGYHAHAEDEKRSDDGDSRSDESESRIYFRTPSRTGLFTVDELDVPRVVPESMLKQARANVFLSSNFYDCEKLLVVVQGAGMIRPGQWSRSICITHSVHAGSVLDYLYLAKELNMGVLVLNPNQNELKLRIRALDPPGTGVMSAQHVYGVPGHNTHIAHILTVFDDFIERSKAKELYFVGNGRGGDTILQLLNHRFEGTPVAPSSAPYSSNGSSTPSTSSLGSIPGSPRTPGPALRSKRTTRSKENGLATRLSKIAFINSAHTRAYANSEKVKTAIAERSVHWVLSPLPLDTIVPEQDDMYGCTCVSSGHSKADFAAACTPNSVFRFFFNTDASPHNSPGKRSAAGSPIETSTPLPFTPRVIPFSNPPQLGDGKRKKKVSRSGEGDTDDSDDSDVAGSDTNSASITKRARRASTLSTSSTATPKLVESHVSQRSLGPSRIDSFSSYESHTNPIHWVRRRYGPGDEKFDPLIDLVEMVEMGTQTDRIVPDVAEPPREASNTSPLRDSNGLSAIVAELYPEMIEVPPLDPPRVITPPPRIITPPPSTLQPTPSTFEECHCPMCRISSWILASKTSALIFVALLTTGAFVGRHFLAQRQMAKHIAFKR